MGKRMEKYKENLDKIKELLENYPKGMTITEISETLDINRNLISKLLDILLILGNVDMKKFGPAKVYFLSERVPVSTLLNFTSDYILVLNKKFDIVQVNENFLAFLDLKREDLINKNLLDVSLPLFHDTELKKMVNSTLKGKEITKEFQYLKGEEQLYFRGKFIPSIFSTGSKGVTIILEDITESKKAEIEIKKSENKLRRIFKSIPDLFFLVSDDSTILEWSGDEDQTYIPPKKFLGKKMKYLLPKRLSKLSYEMIKKTLETKEPQTIEYSLLMDGALHFYEARHLHYSENKVAIFIRNISKRKETEVKLRETKEQFKTITEQNLMGIGILQDEKIVYANRKLADIAGRSRKEVLKMKLRDVAEFIHPEDREFAITQAKKKQLNNDRDIVLNYSYRIFTKDKKIKWINQYSKTISYNGRPADLMMCIDITEQKNAELRLKNSEKRFRAIAEQTLMGIAIIQDAELKYVNKRAIEISGYTKEELLNFEVEDISNIIIYPEDRKFVMEQLKKKLKGKKDTVKTYIFRIYNKSKEIRKIRIYSNTITYNEKLADLLLFFDITGEHNRSEK
ncbi:MAG: PAS domain S-box protein [Candidatus Lokiarchaeota archaeon]|nr:PAS domain S-box protein [Candidatus Lokiarchaeota archaeon]